MRFDASMESLINIGRSESFADLNNTEFGMTKSISFMGQPNHRDLFLSSQSKEKIFLFFFSIKIFIICSLFSFNRFTKSRLWWSNKA